jgi:uncharacterized membrane protein YhhN
MAVVLLLVVAAAAAVVDWWAVATDRPGIERWAKPATMAALIGVAAVAGDPGATVRVALVVGAVFGLVGDVALLDDAPTAFLLGLSAFAVGHLGYVVAAAASGFDGVEALPGVAVMSVLVGFRFASRIVPGARDDGGTVLASAVVGYGVVIGAMVVTAWGTGADAAAAGATSFAVSDWVLGHRRFVGPLPGGRLAIMIPYHVGQAALIVGLATA